MHAFLCKMTYFLGLIVEGQNQDDVTWKEGDDVSEDNLQVREKNKNSEYLYW